MPEDRIINLIKHLGFELIDKYRYEDKAGEQLTAVFRK